MKPFKETKAFEIIKKVIPSVAGTAVTAIGGPFAGALVANVLAKHDSGEIKLSDEERLSLQDYLVQLAKLENEEMANARAREIAIVRAGKSNLTQNILAYLSAALFVFMVIWVLVKGLRDMTTEESLIMGTIIGAVIGNYKDIHGYMFGSSKGSKEKDEMIKQITATTNDN